MRRPDWLPLVAFVVADQSICAHSPGRLESHHMGM